MRRTPALAAIAAGLALSLGAAAQQVTLNAADHRWIEQRCISLGHVKDSPEYKQCYDRWAAEILASRQRNLRATNLP
ncbi:MAG: hypothetical protein FJX65_11930 [Alphaproteobacteria bacterium]|nr:hypothetical protein [Alphaproteobacteria bacterium]